MLRRRIAVRAEHQDLAGVGDQQAQRLAAIVDDEPGAPAQAIHLFQCDAEALRGGPVPPVLDLLTLGRALDGAGARVGGLLGLTHPLESLVAHAFQVGLLLVPLPLARGGFGVGLGLLELLETPRQFGLRGFVGGRAESRAHRLLRIRELLGIELRLGQAEPDLRVARAQRGGLLEMSGAPDRTGLQRGQREKRIGPLDVQPHGLFQQLQFPRRVLFQKREFIVRARARAFSRGRRD